MKKIFFAALAVIGLLSACDDNTDTLGSSLTDDADILTISVDTFEVQTKSLRVDSVLNRSITGYLGRVIDPETGILYTSDFITQFALINDYNLTTFDGTINPVNENGDLCSYCYMRLYIDSYYGDSLATMQMSVNELSKPMEEGVHYYSDFDPEEEGFIRTGGLKASRTYTVVDHSVTDSIRSLSSWQNNIIIPLNQAYTDKNGRNYNNIGSYVLKMYNDHQEYFKNSYTFIHNVLPGFYIKNVSGLGSMSGISQTEFCMTCNVTQKIDDVDSTMNLTTSFTGTDEVIQSSHMSRNTSAIQDLVDDNTCTYVKTPASICTEVDVPVLSIFDGHENDSINSAKVVFQGLNPENDYKYNFSAPATLLIIQKDSADNFFRNSDIANYRTTFIASYSSSANSYTFNNISSLVQTMYTAYRKGITEDPQWAAKHPGWNKLLLVPVKATYTTYSSSSVLTDICNDLSLSSIRLVGGSQNPHAKIKMSVVYSSFSE